MPSRRRIAALSLITLAAFPFPAAAQGMFDPFGDSSSNRPVRKQKADPDAAPAAQGNVIPERVDKGALPDLAPAAADTPPQPQDAGPGNAGSADTGQMYERDSPQFDPLEARRNNYRPEQRPAAPASVPAPAPSQYDNQDGGNPGDRDYGDNAGPPPRGQAMHRQPPPPDDRLQRDEPASAPVGTAASRLNYDPWTGIPVAELEDLLSRIELPPRSAAVHDLWLRLITTPAGGGADPRLAAIRADALNRTGLTRQAAEALAEAGDVSGDPVIATLAARTAIGAGDTQRGCETARVLTSAVAARMPQNLKGEVILIAGFCAAVSGNTAAVGIAAGLAAENGLQDHAGPDALKAIAAGQKPAVPPGKKVSLLDYRILQLSGPVDVTPAIPTASPALLAVLARDAKADPASRLAAAEAAATLNAISVDELAQAYRDTAGDLGGNVELSDAADGQGQPARRAQLYASAVTERAPLRKARVIRAFLDEARRAGLLWPALQLMARPANDLQPVPEIGWFAETAVEASLAGGDYNAMQRWSESAARLDGRDRADLRHWMALADIADPNPNQSRTQNLGSVEELAQRGRFDPALLHRLATVLDALDTNVPIPLWEAASRTEQPSGGHLPDTGVLSQLQDAAKKRDFARTVLLAMRTLGPDGAEGAHMIALGDAIRALKRAGLEPEARRLGLEALFVSWPRAAVLN
jgi:hypothetical protein